MKRLGIPLALILLISAVASCTAPVADESVKYDLTVSSTVGGEVTTPGEGVFAYDEGTTIDLVAEAEEGYQFVKWIGDVDTIADINAASTTITMNGDYEIIAKFEEIYELTVSSTKGGSVTTPGEGVFTYEAGAVVSLVASPASGHRFANWTGDVDTIANVEAASTTITIHADCSITAGFEEIPPVRYTLTVSSTPGGSIAAPGEGVFVYDSGTVVDLWVEADEGYRFLKWIGDVDTIENVHVAGTTVTMNGDYSITANFEEIPPGQYRLTILNAGGGSVVEPGEGSFSYDAGTVVDLVATPASGYRFVNWTGDVDTVASGDGASTTVTMNSEVFIIANFRGEGFLLHCGGVLDPEGWWYYSVEWDAELGVQWHEALFIRSPDRFISDTSDEAANRGGRTSIFWTASWARIYHMTEQAEGEERRVIVASWCDARVFRAAFFAETEENKQSLIRDSMDLDGPSGEFAQFVRDTVELSDDVITGWTVHWESRVR